MSHRADCDCTECRLSRVIKDQRHVETKSGLIVIRDKPDPDPYPKGRPNPYL